MLTENDVVENLAKFLESKGYYILSSQDTNSKGVDLVAKKGDESLHIEAKGGTSSKPFTARFGKPFTKNQIKSHIAGAIYKTLRNKADLEGKGNCKVGIALPLDDNHMERVKQILPYLKKLEFEVFMVGENMVNVL